MLCVGLAVLGSCASPRDQVRDALVAEGLPPPVAVCMADRMRDRLTLGELSELRRARDPDGRKLTELTPFRLVERARRVGDVKVIAVTGEAALACSPGGISISIP